MSCVLQRHFHFMCNILSSSKILFSVLNCIFIVNPKFICDADAPCCQCGLDCYDTSRVFFALYLLEKHGRSVLSYWLYPTFSVYRTITYVQEPTICENLYIA